MVVTGRNAAIHEVEVEVIAENAMVVAVTVDEVTVAAIREVVALLAIVMVNYYASYRKDNKVWWND